MVFAQQLSFDSAGLVNFAPSEQEYTEELTCESCGGLLPSPTSPEVILRLQRQGNPNQSYQLLIKRSNWLPNNEIELEAQYTIKGNQSGTTVTNWLSIEESLTRIFSGNDPVTIVSVVYRLPISGLELAGNYSTTITYQEQRSQKTVQHQLQINFPLVVILRINKSILTTGSASISFDYVSKVEDYIEAVVKGTPLSFSSTDLSEVEVFSNNPSGYTVMVSASLFGGTGLNLDNLRLVLK